jgi:hypothetical protein
MTRRIKAVDPARNRHRRLCWTLSLALLAQLLIPIQAHTAWQTGPDGRPIMICTLQGTQPHRRDAEPGDANDALRSSAVRFSLLLAEAVPKPTASLTAPTLIARSAPIDRRAVSLASAGVPRRSIRAPPSI